MASTRIIILIVSFLVSLIVIAVMARMLPPVWGEIVLDIGRETWPVTVQTVQWVVFFIGLGELGFRWHITRIEEREMTRQYLPEDEETVLRPGEDITPIYQKVRNSKHRETCFVPRLIERCVLGFNLSHSADQTNSLLNSSLELFLHEIDLRYNMIRYISWLVPSLGFIGTVVGIMLALNYAGNPANVEAPDMLYQVTKLLGVAFSTTLVALLMAAVLVLIQSFVQSREERALNHAGQYCLDNLINRLYSA